MAVIMKQNYKSYKGIICGILSAVCYGTNPFGALPLYAEGINTASVLFYRFSMAAVMLCVIMLFSRESFSITKKEMKVLLSLGVLFSVSCYTYYQSFRFMDAGIASTILFVYPVMVAVIMAIFYKEKVTMVTVSSILLALVGIWMLYRGEGGITLNTAGVVLVLLASLLYALYIIVVNRSNIQLSPWKQSFYVMLTCVFLMLVYSFTSPELHLQIPPSVKVWFYASWLGLVPTILSLVLMTIAVREIGATPTSIMGALEPITAVMIGVIMFGESFTPRLMIGIALVLLAVTVIVLGKSLMDKIHRNRDLQSNQSHR